MMKTNLSVAVVMLVLSAALSAKDGDDRFLSVFAPLRTEVAALSPDGKRLAYSVRDGDQISILSLEIGAPQQATSVVTVAADKYATGFKDVDYGNSPARIDWMRWVTPERLVVQSNMKFLAMDRNLRGAIFGFNFDGKDARMIYSGREAMGPVYVLRVLPGEPPGVLVFEPYPRGQDWVVLNPFSGSHQKLSSAAYREMWTGLRDREAREELLRQKQIGLLDSIFPRRQLTWFEHHGSSSRFLVQWQGVADPGAFVVVDPVTRQAWEFVRRESASTSTKLHRSEDFDLVDEAGRRYTGTLVMPNSPRVKKAPLILWIPVIFGERVRGRYEPEVQALAEMGFAVAVIDGRQVSLDYKPAPLELANDVVLPEDMYDRLRGPQGQLLRSTDVPGEMAHQVRALDLLADRYPVSRTAVAVFGQNFSGSQALIAAAERPGRFRCVVAINPMPEDRMKSTHGYPEFIAAIAKVKTAPVESVVVWSSRTPRGLIPGMEPARFALSDLKKNGVKTEWKFLPREFGARQPAARAAVFREIEEFLTEHLISYSVKIGEMTELESIPAADPAPKP